MIELQKRLAQDYQRQREFELSRHMAQTSIQDNTATDQTMLVRHADVERFGSRSPQLHQTSNPASRDLQPGDRLYTVDHSDQVYPRSGQQVAARWPQSNVTGSGLYGDNYDRQQSDQVKAMPVGHGSVTVDDFVQQLKSHNAK